MIVNITCKTALVSTHSHHAITFSVVPYFSINPNIAPVFEGVNGYELPEMLLYIDHDYTKQSYPLPPIVDVNGNNVWVDLSLGREGIFTYFDNSTRSFKFYDKNISSSWKGRHRVTITIGDDHWLGSRTSTYYLTFNVEKAPQATVVKAPEDKSYKGADISDMDLTGKVSIKFKEPMYMNPKYQKAKKSLLRMLDETNSTNSTNTTWVIHEKPPERPPIPSDLSNLDLDPAYIDDAMFEVYVDPSSYQDKSKVNLTWYAEGLSADKLDIQVLYNNYEYISIEGLDELVISLKKNDVFLSQKDGKQIFNKGYSIRKKLRKQLPPAAKQRKDTGGAGKSTPLIDSEFYESSISRFRTYAKVITLGLLFWTFVTGNKNLDFLWSYLGVLQVMSHFALLKIQIPMNAIVMSKALLSVGLMDFKDW